MKNPAGGRRFHESSLRWGMVGLPPVFSRRIDRLAKERGRLEEPSDSELMRFLSLYTWAQWPRIFVADMLLAFVHWALWRMRVPWEWLSELILWMLMVVPISCALLVFAWWNPGPKYNPLRIWWIRHSQLIAFVAVLSAFLGVELVI
jgi:hypothetical protein